VNKSLNKLWRFTCSPRGYWDWVDRGRSSRQQPVGPTPRHPQRSAWQTVAAPSVCQHPSTVRGPRPLRRHRGPSSGGPAVTVTTCWTLSPQGLHSGNWSRSQSGGTGEFLPDQGLRTKEVCRTTRPRFQVGIVLCCVVWRQKQPLRSTQPGHPSVARLAVSISISWGANRHTAHCIGLVSVVTLQCKLVSGW